MRKGNTIRAQPVQVRRVDMWVVQTMNRVKPLHIRSEPKDVVGSVWRVFFHSRKHCRELRRVNFDINYPVQNSLHFYDSGFDKADDPAQRD